MSQKSNIKRILAIAVLLTFALTFFTIITPSVFAQTKTGPASDAIIFKRVPLDVVPEALKAGDIDYYIFGLRPSQAIALRTIPGIDLYYAPAGLVDIILNPAPYDGDKLNPLSIKEVRFALNYILNRDYVVNEIYKGFASPMITFLSSYDPDFVTIYDIVAKYEFGYNPELANSLVTAALTKAGASKVGGKWTYKGQPISFNFIIRIEDERREIGDAFASELEKLGFTVNRQYMPFAQAIDIVYGTDPKEHQWDLYTEGWGKSAPDKYEFGTINQMGAPWFGYMPGWTEPTFWNYQNSTIDNLGQKIYNGQFKSKSERDQLYRKTTEMIIQESIRIWAATRLDIHPAKSEVKGLTNDLGTGLRSPLTTREAYITGKSTLTIGNLWVHTATSVWNPFGGHQDVYSVDIWRAVSDPFIWNHPFSGLPQPFRAQYTVKTAGPDGKLDVPSDAFMWDATSQSWKTVGSGVKATSMVTLDFSKYIGGKWHDGTTITWADLLWGIYAWYDLAYNPTKASLEGALASQIKAIIEPVKGYRINGNNLEVYLDYWHFDPNYIASFAIPFYSFPSLHYPWVVGAAMDDVVFNKKAASYSQATSRARNVPWLSMVLKDHASMVADSLTSLKSSGFFPSNVFTVGGKSYATSGEVAARIDSALNWFNTYGHLVISDGPFYLYKYDPAAQYAEIRAFRDPTYPFSPGKWYYGKPETPQIKSVNVPTVLQGQAAKVEVELQGPTPLGVIYLIKDTRTGAIMGSGSGTAVSPTRFSIELSPDFTSKLSVGVYELTIAGFSEQVAFVTSEKRYFDVMKTIPTITVTTPTISPTGTITTSTITASPTISTTVVPTLTFTTEMPSGLGTAYIGIGVGLVIGVLVLAVVLMKRKKA
ncbi:MAG: ABC transporter substrate-binding protein [Nitrososphaeria archaeon]